MIRAMMLNLRTHPLLERIPTRSFATLMELYESNYILMRRLAPGLRALDGHAVSSVAGGVDLHLKTLACSPYTTTLAMSHWFEHDPEAVEPDLLIRVYHDAKLAEVLPDTPVEQFTLWRGAPPDRRSLVWRWELNRFLNRWLRYCLSEGHGFPRES